MTKEKTTKVKCTNCETIWEFIGLIDDDFEKDVECPECGFVCSAWTFIPNVFLPEPVVRTKFNAGDKVKYIGDSFNEIEPGDTGVIIEYVKKGDTVKALDLEFNYIAKNDIYLIEWDKGTEEKYLLASEQIEMVNAQ